MNDLVDRLESSVKPSRELDGEIAKAIGWSTFMFGGAGLCWKTPDGEIEPVPPRYTESIDSALKLVPEGWYPDELSFPPERTTRRTPHPTPYWFSIYPPIGHKAWERGYVDGRGSSPAIAICAAAMRARQAANSGP